MKVRIVALDAMGDVTWFMEMMFLGVKFFGSVTTGTQRIAFGAEFKRVRFVTIHAGNAMLEHFALTERTPGVILVALLPIGIISGLRQQCRVMRVFQRFAGQAAFNQC